MDICDAINVSEEGYVVQLIGLLCLVQSLLSITRSQSWCCQFIY